MSSNLFFVKKRKWKSIDDYGGYTPKKVYSQKHLTSYPNTSERLMYRAF